MTRKIRAARPECKPWRRDWINIAYPHENSVDVLRRNRVDNEQARANIILSSAMSDLDFLLDELTGGPSQPTIDENNIPTTITVARPSAMAVTELGSSAKAI